LFGTVKGRLELEKGRCGIERTKGEKGTLGREAEREKNRGGFQ